jgi:predicted ArsR family transcriptional regulator
VTKQLPLKTQIIDALIAGDTTTLAVCARTGLPRTSVAPIITELRRSGVIVVVHEYAAYNGGPGRPGHIYKLAEAKHG